MQLTGPRPGWWIYEARDSERHDLRRCCDGWGPLTLTSWMSMGKRGFTWSYGGCTDGLGGTKVLVDRRTLQNP